ncbi:MAG: leucine-rich repeat domain-containing protein [Oscillospiraceae bacterium]|nr:leucine-rich repeat domain-containing protein [Oscillospiraceae bacterium]
MSTAHKGYGHHLRRLSISALIIVAVCLVVIITSALIINLVLIPSAKYKTAVSDMDSGNYIKAIQEFIALDDYKDSLDKTVTCLEFIYGIELESATTTALSPWWVITADGQVSFDQSAYNGDGDLSIPQVIDGIIVTSIAEYGFSNSYEIITVDIPNTVTELQEGAFYYCTALQSITLPSSVRKIGDSAFFSNMSLKSVELPSSLSTLGIGAFENCANLVSVNIPRRLSVISSSAFKSCTALQTITFDGTPKEIAGAAFSGCTSLDTVYYHGTQSNWSTIVIVPDNEPLLNAEIIFEQ